MKQSLAKFKKILVLVLFTAFAGFAHAETPTIDSTIADSAAVDTAQKLSPFDHLGQNMLLSAFGWPLGFHMLGGALTYKFSMKNNDLIVARFAARQDQLVTGIAFTPGMMMGTFFPILVPGYMYFFSDNHTLNNTGAVAVQATAVAFLYNNFLKAISAREHPDAKLNSGERSRDFKWGFFRRGVFYGWPSGHSMTNAAMAMSITSYNRDKPLVVAGCALYAGYIATSMVLGAKGEAHWLIKGILKGKYNALRIVRTVINAGVIGCVLFLIISGVMLSNHVFTWLGIESGASFARTAHMLASHWYLVFVSLHIGLHLSLFIRGRVATGIAAALGAYGIYTFVARGLWKYLTLQQPFFFLDLERGYLLFTLDYIAIMALFAMAMHLAMTAMVKYSR